MKKLLLVTLISFISFTVLSQSCLPEGINFESQEQIDWGEYNRPMSPDKFNGVLARMQAFQQGEELFVQDVYAGADPDYSLKVRVITEKAWQSLIARNMLITTENREELKNFIPDFTVICLPGLKLNPSIDGTRSSTGIILKS